MSRHEGVSCDSCLKGNFRGRRYKCLICYDYDLCATCYEAGATTTRHTTDHPMQCILTRTDFDLYYGGEALTAEQPQAFSCPFCGKMGYTETTLQEHVTSEHADTSTEVVCPICAALPGGDPNHVTDDFAAHLTLEHRSPRDFDEPAGIRHVRRIPHPSRGVGATRTRRTNMHFSSAGSTLTGLSPSGRETMDPIAELLSQLSSVRSRAAAAQSVSSQLQQLEMQLQSTRQQLERLPRRSADSAANAGRGTVATASSGAAVEMSNSMSSNNNVNSQFLLARCRDDAHTEANMESLERERTDRGLFVQELLLSTLTEQLQLGDIPEWISSLTEESEAGLQGGPPFSGVEAGATSQTSSGEEIVENTLSQRPPPPTEMSTQGLKRKVGATAVQGHSAVVTVPSSAGLQSQTVGPAQVLVQGPAIRAPLPSPGQQQGPPTSQGLQCSNTGSGAGVAVGASPQSHSRPPPGGMRDPRMNPTAAKRNLLKHVEATKKSEPPPH